MVHFSRRRFLKGSSTAAAVSAAVVPMIGVKDAQAGQGEQVRKNAQVRLKRQPRADAGATATEAEISGAKTDGQVRVERDDSKDALP